LIDGVLGGYSYDNFSTEAAVTWLRTKARESKAQGQPWFMLLIWSIRTTSCTSIRTRLGRSCRASRRPTRLIAHLAPKFTLRSGTFHFQRRGISHSTRRDARALTTNTRPHKTVFSGSGRTKTADGESCRITTSTASATATPTWRGYSRN